MFWPQQSCRPGSCTMFHQSGSSAGWTRPQRREGSSPRVEGQTSIVLSAGVGSARGRVLGWGVLWSAGVCYVLWCSVVWCSVFWWMFSSEQVWPQRVWPQWGRGWWPSGWTWGQAHSVYLVYCSVSPKHLPLFKMLTSSFWVCHVKFLTLYVFNYFHLMLPN